VSIRSIRVVRVLLHAMPKNTTGIEPRRINPRSLAGCRSFRFASGYCYFGWRWIPVPFGSFFFWSEIAWPVFLAVDLACAFPSVGRRSSLAQPFGLVRSRHPLASRALRRPVVRGGLWRLPPPCGLSVASALLT